MQSISTFHTGTFINALKAFFKELNVPINYLDDAPTDAAAILGDKYKANNQAHILIYEVYVLGIVDDAIFGEKNTFQNIDALKNLTTDYNGLLIVGVKLKKDSLPTRGQLAEITRVFNQVFPYTPVSIVFQYDHFISFANSERIGYKQAWREGEKVGKVTMLKDVDTIKPHAAHLKILSGLAIDKEKISSFAKLYQYWQSIFSLQTLNNQFYADLQAWFYYASQNIKLPYKPDYINEKENSKNFLVRLLARTMFCWFVKEKGLIQPELLELIDWDGNKYPLTKDIEHDDFLYQNSYYRGILQNVFYHALNQKEKKTHKDFKWTKYIHPNFNLDWLTQIPYLNGGIFDKLAEDNAQESIEDTVIKIPNFLFYGITQNELKSTGKGEKTKTELKKIEHKGLNGILKAYKFTLDENTPFEEDIALDPEMLGLVFENLLAELDPNLEESTIKSIKKQTGSYYTPRKVIYEMVNDSLSLYLSQFLKTHYPHIADLKKQVNELIYFNQVDAKNDALCRAIVHALDQFKVLDPACGSGAFPMGMLHRMVDILKLVDNTKEKWVELKLRNVDAAHRNDFKKVLTSHLDDYGRKLGIIRDSIYGIDIQPLAVQITKLRFFISLLIDQKVEKGITPMPNIETKIICADSLKNIEADLFSPDAIEKLTDARTRYYQPDISHIERQTIANEIVSILDVVFPSFAFQITGKKVVGQNKGLLLKWFKEATVTAPFFNMDFFFPELKEIGGFDCVIGNPPYGGTKISDEVRSALDIESKDPYGAFIARFLNGFEKTTPLKHGGVLAYIVSDTFMTIKSHFKLRKHLMQNYVHKMLRVHPDTFRATVNTVIIIAERNTQKTFDAQHICLMADLTNISIHDNYEHFIAVLNQTKGVDFAEISENINNEKYAIYYYPQSLIKTNSNLPFFVASPKLFALMNNSNKVFIESSEIGIKYITELNNSKLDLFQLGDEYTGSGKSKKWEKGGVLKIISGIKTGNNEKYIFKSKNGNGNYKLINKSALLSDKDISCFNNDDIVNGINSADYSGKYIVPLDKGGESDSGDGWMPNYFVQTDYYIDWRKESVKGMSNEPHSDLANVEFRFKVGLTYSRTGIYAPTFRISSGGILESKGCGLFADKLDAELILGILNAKLLKFVIKNYVMHSIESSVGSLPQTLISIPSKKKANTLISLVSSIIQTQKINPRYDYASHEQIAIDKIVYESYCLNAADVEEVENWYARRYPKLSAAQKANLRALGKSDNYLELYGLS